MFTLRAVEENKSVSQASAKLSSSCMTFELILLLERMRVKLGKCRVADRPPLWSTGRVSLYFPTPTTRV